MSLHPTQLEAFGTHCKHPQCGLADFLPFTCAHCRLHFCSAHRLPSTHACTAFTEEDARAADVRATLCPLCHEPLPLENVGGRGADVNLAMEAHLDGGKCKTLRNQDPVSGVLVDDGAVQIKAKKTENQCRYERCAKRMWVDIRCERCTRPFCPAHREPKSHRCGALAASPSSSANASSANLASASAKPGPLAALRAQKASFSAAPKPPTSSPSPPTASKPLLNMAKLQAALPSGSSAAGAPSSRTTAKRAAQERASALQGLKVRAAKGLLSEEEKYKYASMQAVEANGRKGGSNGKDCTVQ